MTTVERVTYDDGLTDTQRIVRDESALRDALAYLETCPADERASTERDIAAIRSRLPGHGAHAETAKAKWVRGHNFPSDPAGTVRLRRIPAEGEPFPKGPRNGGSLAAIAPLALVVVSGAWRMVIG